MKKTFLILLVLILLGGGCFGGWYFITNQASQKGINIKLKATENYVIDWNPSLTQDQKNELLWGFDTEQEFISAFIIEMGADKAKNQVLELKDDFTGKLYYENANEYETIYYITANNNQRILFFYDENCTERIEGEHALYTGITFRDGKYWNVFYTATNYDTDTINFSFLIEYEQVI